MHKRGSIGCSTSGKFVCLETFLFYLVRTNIGLDNYKNGQYFPTVYTIQLRLVIISIPIDTEHMLKTII